ncbi:MAG: DUF6473 family protein [Alphaproteobacteria bacterium]
MAYAFPGEGALDYFPCNYGASRLTFRGPRRSLDRPYIAFLGGTETYGKYVPDPFPDLVEEEVGLTSINLGCVNAGADVYLNDPEVIEIARGAQAVVVQTMGAVNVANSYYSVHPRRNDRLISVSPCLRALYREVDFTEFNFTRHMMTTLKATSEKRFEVVAANLRNVWTERMHDLLGQLGNRTILLWMSDQPPGRSCGLDHDPVLVDEAMIAAIRPKVLDYVEVISSREAQRASLQGMAFAALESLAASALPGPLVHRDVARQLARTLTTVLT